MRNRPEAFRLKLWLLDARRFRNGAVFRREADEKAGHGLSEGKQLYVGFCL